MKTRTNVLAIKSSFFPTPYMFLDILSVMSCSSFCNPFSVHIQLQWVTRLNRRIAKLVAQVVPLFQSRELTQSIRHTFAYAISVSNFKRCAFIGYDPDLRRSAYHSTYGLLC